MNNGNSVTHTYRYGPSCTGGRPMSLRNVPKTSHVVIHSSATRRIKSPSTAPIVETNAIRSASDKNLATGDSTAESAPTFIHTRPFAPIFFARSVRASSLLRPYAAASGYVAASTRMPLMHSAPANALNSVAEKSGVNSTNSIPKRKSGLSIPKRSIASRHVIRSMVGGASPVTAVAAATTARPMNSRTSSWDTNDISASNCMNSY